MLREKLDEEGGPPVLEGGVGRSLLFDSCTRIFFRCLMEKTKKPRKMPAMAAPAMPRPEDETRVCLNFLCAH